MNSESARPAIHHVGFVVADIAAAMAGFTQSLLGEWDGRIYDDPYQKVRVAFLATRPGDTLIELVEPATEDSPVTRFLREKGGGLHHICYEVSDLERELKRMKARGANIARRPRPAVAFDDRRIAWVITAEKLVIELLETEAAANEATPRSEAPVEA